VKPIPKITSTSIPSPLPHAPIPKGAVVGPLSPEREKLQRQMVILEALKWVGTPYRSNQDVLGAGIDCAMLLVRAWVDAGVFEPFDPRPYPSEWHLHHSEERYLAWLIEFAVEVPEELAQPGDIIVYRFGRCFSHGGIILDAQHIIHAFIREEQCNVIERFNTELLYMQEAPQTPPRVEGPKQPTRLLLPDRPRKCFDVWAKLRALPVGAASAVGGEL